MILEMARVKRNQGIGTCPQEFIPEGAFYRDGTKQTVKKNETLECNTPAARGSKSASEADCEGVARVWRNGEEIQKVVYVLFMQRKVIWGRCFYDDDVHVREATHRRNLCIAHEAAFFQRSANLPEPPLHGFFFIWFLGYI